MVELQKNDRKPPLLLQGLLCESKSFILIHVKFDRLISFSVFVTIMLGSVLNITILINAKIFHSPRV